jgi:hypothetical protein
MEGWAIGVSVLISFVLVTFCPVLVWHLPKICKRTQDFQVSECPLFVYGLLYAEPSHLLCGGRGRRIRGVILLYAAISHLLCGDRGRRTST